MIAPPTLYIIKDVSTGLPLLETMDWQVAVDLVKDEIKKGVIFNSNEIDYIIVNDSIHNILERSKHFNSREYTHETIIYASKLDK